MSDAVIGRRGAAARKTRGIIGYVILSLVALLFASPLIFMLATSFKPLAEVFSTPPSLWGSEIRWQNYVEAFTAAPLVRYLFNGLLVAAVGTALNLVVSVLSGYAFARLRFRGRNTVFVIFLATMMLPQDVLIIPLFQMMIGFNWLNTFAALIIPFAFTALGGFLCRQFFLTVPQELDDAARIDGAGTSRTFFSIMLPLARPTLAVLAVFSFIGYWNSFLWPLIVVQDVNVLGTIPLGLQTFLAQQGARWNLLMAASVVSMIPTTALLIVLQRHLVRGILTSGLGGR